MSEHAQPTGEKASLLSNILAVVGLIILVIIIVWGLVHVAELSSGWVTSLFGKDVPTVVVKAPSDATSGAPVTISWDYSTAATGTYAFLYQCHDGLEFASIDTEKHTASGIACGSAFAITPTNNSVQILPLIAGTTSMSVPFSIVFTPTVGAQVQGSATMIIHPGSVAVSPPEPVVVHPKPVVVPTTHQKPHRATTYRAPRVYSPADISVRIISVAVDPYGNATATFDITNIGGTRSNAYYFNATLPTQSPTPYTSSIQSPLSPGSHIENTLHFSQATSGSFSVNVNPQDVNENNNYASQWINVPTNYSYSDNSYNPYPQYQSYPYQY